MLLGIVALLLVGFCLFVAVAPGQLTKVLLASAWALMAAGSVILVLVALVKSWLR